jgi:hypothetical protein
LLVSFFSAGTSAADPGMPGASWCEHKSLPGQAGLSPGQRSKNVDLQKSRLSPAKALVNCCPGCNIEDWGWALLQE